MLQPSLRIAACAASLSLPLFAQTGNEVIFVGSSTSGSTDQHVFAESATGAVLVASGNSWTDNVTDAVWANQGRRLYVGQSLMDQVSVAEWNGSVATWSTLWPSTTACYGVELDIGRNRLWTLTGGNGNQELVCIDVDIQSPNYGQMITQTNVLAGTTRERWGLSRSGELACAPSAFLGGNDFTLVDLNPSSANYLQIITSTSITGAAGAGFAFCVDSKISIDDLYVYVLWSGIGSASGLAVWDITGQAWLDFSPLAGQQDFMLPLGVPNKMDLSLDRSFAVISGQGGAGWATRVNFDYVTPSNTSSTQYAGLIVPDCNGITLSPEQSRVAVTSTQTFLSTPSELTVFDVNSGAVLQNVNLSSMWNVYTTAWQDGSPVAEYSLFGSGCAGTGGTPSLAAAAGSRPALGATFQVEVQNLPFGVAVMATGLSSSITTTGLPLPLDLSIIGMVGCTQYVDALVLDVIQNVGTTATWTWAIPNTASLFGFPFYNQAFSLDPAANSFGFTASNAGRGVLGY